MYIGKYLSPERSDIIGKSRDYSDYCCLCEGQLISGYGFPTKNPFFFFFQKTKAQLVKTDGYKYFTCYSASANRSSSGISTVRCK